MFPPYQCCEFRCKRVFCRPYGSCCRTGRRSTFLSTWISCGGADRTDWKINDLAFDGMACLKELVAAVPDRFLIGADITGFPNPAALESGRMQAVPQRYLYRVRGTESKAQGVNCKFRKTPPYSPRFARGEFLEKARRAILRGAPPFKIRMKSMLKNTV